ncbi:hypothetical protein ACFSCZ_03755 [Siminovitchia sediminis]|uniref:Flagellar hook-length control protein FliK n=1 Tax=Siminovitchia sediminis TaxID=1274353 RepID=A0ABW4KI44_9BACI
MNVHTVTKNLLRTFSSDPSSPLILRQGQIFFAQVQKIYPNQHAEIQLGSRQLIARLEAPLESGKGYFLQVDSHEGELRLKLLGTRQQDVHLLMKQMSLPNEKGFRSLADLLMKEPLSLTRDQLYKAGQWIQAAADKELALEVIQFIHHQNLPFKESVFQALFNAGSKESLTQLITGLRDVLAAEKPSSASQKIISIIDEFGVDSERHSRVAVPAALSGREALAKIKHSIEQMGLFSGNHNTRQQISQAETLRSLLVQYLGAKSGKSNQAALAAEKLLHRINGQQLLSIDTGPVQQLFFELPVNLNGFRTDISFLWEGKRNKKGKIDPAYCRVIFYLHLPSLKETVVDVKIQNRVTTITIFNDFPAIKALADPLLPEIKKQLSTLDYEISSVEFKKTLQKKEKKLPAFRVQSYSGVDIQV